MYYTALPETFTGENICKFAVLPPSTKVFQRNFVREGKGRVKQFSHEIILAGFHPQKSLAVIYTNVPLCRWFLQLCVQGYLCLRPYQEQVVSLISLMLDTGFPCFRRNSIEELR